MGLQVGIPCAPSFEGELEGTEIGRGKGPGTGTGKVRPMEVEGKWDGLEIGMSGGGNGGEVEGRWKGWGGEGDGKGARGGRESWMYIVQNTCIN